MTVTDPREIGTLEGKGGQRHRPDGSLMPVRGSKKNKWQLPRSLPEKYDEHGLCVGYKAHIYDDKQHGEVNYFDAWEGKRPTGIKRMRLRCPRCGRRVLSSVRVCHDGCCVFHDIPPHKPKGWWKK